MLLLNSKTLKQLGWNKSSGSSYYTNKSISNSLMLYLVKNNNKISSCWTGNFVVAFFSDIGFSVGCMLVRDSEELGHANELLEAAQSTGFSEVVPTKNNLIKSGFVHSENGLTRGPLIVQYSNNKGLVVDFVVKYRDSEILQFGHLPKNALGKIINYLSWYERHRAFN